MTERTTPLTYQNAEARADAAILSGDSVAANDILLHGIQHNYTHAPNHYHHMALKNIALPFYNILRQPEVEAAKDACYDVYGWVGNLLENELEYLKNYRSKNSQETSDCIGRISELTVFSLPARDYTTESNFVFVPASQSDDKNHHYGTDFYCIPLHGGPSDHYSVQVKTALNDAHRAHYSESISLIGLNQLSPHYNKPEHDDSLASCMLRELAGTATAEDIATLNTATDTMYNLILNQSYVENAS